MKINGPAWQWPKLSTEVLTTLVIGVTVLVGAGMMLAVNFLSPGAPVG